MDYEIIWLAEARQSLDAEMEYVFVEFGRGTLEKVYSSLMERVLLLQTFPRIGVRQRLLDYRGHEIRMLHVKKVSVVYAIQDKTVVMLYVWNNRRNPKDLAGILEEM